MFVHLYPCEFHDINTSDYYGEPRQKCRGFFMRIRFGADGPGSHFNRRGVLHCRIELTVRCCAEEAIGCAVAAAHKRVPHFNRQINVCVLQLYVLYLFCNHLITLNSFMLWDSTTRWLISPKNKL
jgi:hypothetical protein